MNGSVYLAHHGVKGQKWGVRRYQNKNGHELMSKLGDMKGKPTVPVGVPIVGLNVMKDLRENQFLR